MKKSKIVMFVAAAFLFSGLAAQTQNETPKKGDPDSKSNFFVRYNAGNWKSSALQNAGQLKGIRDINFILMNPNGLAYTKSLSTPSLPAGGGEFGFSFAGKNQSHRGNLTFSYLGTSTYRSSLLEMQVTGGTVGSGIDYSTSLSTLTERKGNNLNRGGIQYDHEFYILKNSASILSGLGIRAGLSLYSDSVVQSGYSYGFSSMKIKSSTSNFESNTTGITGMDSLTYRQSTADALIGLIWKIPTFKEQSFEIGADYHKSIASKGEFLDSYRSLPPAGSSGYLLMMSFTTTKTKITADYYRQGSKLRLGYHIPVNDGFAIKFGFTSYSSQEEISSIAADSRQKNLSSSALYAMMSGSGSSSMMSSFLLAGLPDFGPMRTSTEAINYGTIEAQLRF